MIEVNDTYPSLEDNRNNLLKKPTYRVAVVAKKDKLKKFADIGQLNASIGNTININGTSFSLIPYSVNSYNFIGDGEFPSALYSTPDFENQLEVDLIGGIDPPTYNFHKFIYEQLSHIWQKPMLIKKFRDAASNEITPLHYVFGDLGLRLPITAADTGQDMNDPPNYGKTNFIGYPDPEGRSGADNNSNNNPFSQENDVKAVGTDTWPGIRKTVRSSFGGAAGFVFLVENDPKKVRAIQSAIKVWDTAMLKATTKKRGTTISYESIKVPDDHPLRGKKFHPAKMFYLGLAGSGNNLLFSFYNYTDIFGPQTDTNGLFEINDKPYTKEGRFLSAMIFQLKSSISFETSMIVDKMRVKSDNSTAPDDNSGVYLHTINDTQVLLKNNYYALITTWPVAILNRLNTLKDKIAMLDEEKDTILKSLGGKRPPQTLINAYETITNQMNTQAAMDMLDIANTDFDTYNDGPEEEDDPNKLGKKPNNPEHYIIVPFNKEEYDKLSGGKIAEDSNFELNTNKQATNEINTFISNQLTKLQKIVDTIYTFGPGFGPIDRIKQGDQTQNISLASSKTCSDCYEYDIYRILSRGVPLFYNSDINPNTDIMLYQTDFAAYVKPNPTDRDIDRGILAAGGEYVLFNSKTNTTVLVIKAIDSDITNGIPVNNLSIEHDLICDINLDSITWGPIKLPKVTNNIVFSPTNNPQNKYYIDPHFSSVPLEPIQCIDGGFNREDIASYILVELIYKRIDFKSPNIDRDIQVLFDSIDRLRTEKDTADIDLDLKIALLSVTDGIIDRYKTKLLEIAEIAKQYQDITWYKLASYKMKQFIDKDALHMDLHDPPLPVKDGEVLPLK